VKNIVKNVATPCFAVHGSNCIDPAENITPDNGFATLDHIIICNVPVLLIPYPPAATIAIDPNIIDIYCNPIYVVQKCAS
jgi:hypothetical protein